jgi:hypothetical protein
MWRALPPYIVGSIQRDCETALKGNDAEKHLIECSSSPGMPAPEEGDVLSCSKHLLCLSQFGRIASCLDGGERDFIQAVLGKILEPKLWLETSAFHWIITAELCPAPSHIVRLTPPEAFIDRLLGFVEIHTLVI